MIRTLIFFLCLGILGVLGYYAYEKNIVSSSLDATHTPVVQKVKQRVKVVMYSLQSCGFCIRAKKLLARKGVQIEEYDVSEPPHREEMARRTNNARTVPQIFIGNHYVGGETELRSLDHQGKLDLLLEGQDVFQKP